MFATRQCAQHGCASTLITHKHSSYRTDDLHDLYDLFPLRGLDLSGRANRYIPDLYDLAHVAGREPCNLRDLAPCFLVGPVPYRSCTTSHNTAGEELDDLDHDLSDLSVRGDVDNDLSDLSVRGDLDHDLSI